MGRHPTIHVVGPGDGPIGPDASFARNDPAEGNGKVTLTELLQHSLSDQPLYVAGVWVPQVEAVLCRTHVDQPTLRGVGLDVDNELQGEATLITGGPSTERALGIWCPVCQGNVEASGPGAVVLYVPTAGSQRAVKP
jgi:hypothetical protein